MAICPGFISDSDRVLGLMESADMGCGRKVHMGKVRNDFIDRAFGRGADGVSGILSAL